MKYLTNTLEFTKQYKQPFPNEQTFKGIEIKGPVVT